MYRFSFYTTICLKLLNGIQLQAVKAFIKVLASCTSYRYIAWREVFFIENEIKVNNLERCHFKVAATSLHIVLNAWS